MTTLFLTMVIFLGAVLVLAGIAVATGRVLKGSCGGVGGTLCQCRTEGRPRGSCELGEGELPTLDADATPAESHR